MVNAHISRRSFNKVILTGGLLMSARIPAYALPGFEKKQDGLLHIGAEGELQIYSGIAHLGQHGSEDAVGPVCELLGIRNYRLMSGHSPKHLPSILGQHQTELCFTCVQTNLKAARILSSFLSVGVRSGKYIEAGVAKNTSEFAMSLDPKGMTVAVTT